MEGLVVGQAAQEAPTPPLLVLDRARRMAEVGRTRSYRGNKNTAAAAETARKKTKKLVPVDEDLILQLMWEKACAPRHHYSPSSTWKPSPNDPGDDHLAGVYDKARAIIRECDRHVDALILQYVNNNGDYDEEVQTTKTTTKLKPESRRVFEDDDGADGSSRGGTVVVPEDSVLNLMWHKACAPRRDFPAWKPRPNDTRVELIQAYEKGTAIRQKWHQHDDDLIAQYINNGCAYYEEVQG